MTGLRLGGLVWDLDATIERLRAIFEMEAEARRSQAAILESNYSRAVQNELYERAGDTVKTWEQMIRQKLEELILFPPQHSRHSSFLARFNQDSSYEKSIFVMTKFPTGSTPVDHELQTVIDAVRSSVGNCGYHARIASDREYHAGLWDNVELYLLGCSRGIAIVEDRHTGELNPNVAMEWGWMRAMGKPVYYLVEEGFSRERADWSGLLRSSFAWSNPLPAIEQAIRNWLAS